MQPSSLEEQGEAWLSLTTIDPETPLHMLQSKGIMVMEQPIAAFIGQNGQLEHVRFVDGTQIPRAGGFVTSKFVQSVPFAERLGCEMMASGGIKTDGKWRSAIPGLYIAGDASYMAPSQVVFAAADGSQTYERKYGFDGGRFYNS